MNINKRNEEKYSPQSPEHEVMDEMDEGDGKDYDSTDYGPYNQRWFNRKISLSPEMLEKKAFYIQRGTSLPNRVYFDCYRCMSGREREEYNEYQRIKMTTRNYMDFYRPEWTYLAENLSHFQRACVHKQNMTVNAYEKDLTRRRLYVDEDSINHGVFHPLESLRSFIGFKHGVVKGDKASNLNAPE